MPSILLSGTVADRYGNRIRSMRWFDEDWHIVPFHADAPLAPRAIDDITVAYLSSDILGGSTVDMHEPGMEAFCTILRSAAKLAWLQVPSSGVDRPVYQELARRGVTLTTAAGAAAETVALTALTGLLALSRRLPLWVESKRNRTWRTLRSGPEEPRELRGEKVLIVGCGRIGTHLARMCKSLGMRTHGLRRHPSPPAEPFDESGVLRDLGEAVQSADWVVAACPLTDETRGIFNAELLARFQPHASFINVARGAVACEPDLIEALRRRRIESAYLDVFAVEPLPEDSPLWDLPNVLLSPHSAGDTRGRHARIAEVFLDNLDRWACGKALVNRVE
jgi:phosphoglycerate dehydrogenase-like enzyme